MLRTRKVLNCFLGFVACGAQTAYVRVDRQLERLREYVASPSEWNWVGSRFRNLWGTPHTYVVISSANRHPSLDIQKFIPPRSYHLIPPGRLPRLSLLRTRHNRMCRHILHLHQLLHSQNFTSDFRRVREVHGLEPTVDSKCEECSFNFVPEGNGRPP